MSEIHPLKSYRATVALPCGRQTTVQVKARNDERAHLAAQWVTGGVVAQVQRVLQGGAA